MWLILKLDHFNKEKRRFIYQKTTSKPVFSSCCSAFFVCLTHHLFFNDSRSIDLSTIHKRMLNLLLRGKFIESLFLMLAPIRASFLFITILFRTYKYIDLYPPRGFDPRSLGVMRIVICPDWAYTNTH